MRDDHDVTDMFKVDENFGNIEGEVTWFEELCFWGIVGLITIAVVLVIGEVTGVTTYVLESI